MAVPRQAVIREPEIAGAPSRSFAVEQKAESSGSLTGHGRGHGCEFAELVPWQPVSDECDFRSARRSADPHPITVQVAKFELAPIGRFAAGPAELGHDRVDVAYLQNDQGVGPGTTSVLGQRQPRAVPRDRHERRVAGIEAIHPLLGEAQAPTPGNRRRGISYAQGPR